MFLGSRPGRDKTRAFLLLPLSHSLTCTHATGKGVFSAPCVHTICQRSCCNAHVPVCRLCMPAAMLCLKASCPVGSSHPRTIMSHVQTVLALYYLGWPNLPPPSCSYRGLTSAPDVLGMGWGQGWQGTYTYTRWRFDSSRSQDMAICRRYQLTARIMPARCWPATLPAYLMRGWIGA